MFPIQPGRGSPNGFYGINKCTLVLTRRAPDQAFRVYSEFLFESGTEISQIDLISISKCIFRTYFDTYRPPHSSCVAFVENFLSYHGSYAGLIEDHLGFTTLVL
ncbi:hypothetical protein HI914_05587 [Erysiphe necator]|nr:hypothetical protein HI914_05587 [Erysiphe necator]